MRRAGNNCHAFTNRRQESLLFQPQPGTKLFILKMIKRNSSFSIFSKSATETEEQERSKFANSRNRIRQRLRTLSATTSATKALEILNNKANLENVIIMSIDLDFL